jgi:nitrate reductase NapD
MMQNFNVCGLIVHLSPRHGEAAAEQIARLPGVDIHASSGVGRLVATAVDTATSLAIDQIAAIHRLPGVVAASIVYHGFEQSGGTPPDAPQSQTEALHQSQDRSKGN